MTVLVRMDPEGLIDGCPSWWQNFVFNEGVAGTDACNQVLEKYNARKTEAGIEFNSGADFLFFKMKFEGPTPGVGEWEYRAILIRTEH